MDEETEASAGEAEREDREERLGDESIGGNSQTLQGPAFRCLPFSMLDEPLLPKGARREGRKKQVFLLAMGLETFGKW